MGRVPDVSVETTDDRAVCCAAGRCGSKGLRAASCELRAKSREPRAAGKIQETESLFNSRSPVRVGRPTGLSSNSRWRRAYGPEESTFAGVPSATPGDNSEYWLLATGYFCCRDDQADEISLKLSDLRPQTKDEALHIAHGVIGGSRSYQAGRGSS